MPVPGIGMSSCKIRLLSSTKELMGFLQVIISSFCWSAAASPFGIGTIASSGGPKGQFQSKGVKWVTATRQNVDPGGYLYGSLRPETSSLKEPSPLRSSGWSFPSASRASTMPLWSLSRSFTTTPLSEGTHTPLSRS